MWSKLSGIGSSGANLSDRGSVNFPRAPLACPNHAMKNILPFPNFPPGNISLLRSETSIGSSASIIGSTLSNFAFASKTSDYIQIDTVDKAEAVLDDQELKQLTAVIKMSPSLHALQFAPGDFVALQGFRHESNKGVFQVLKTVGDNSFEIGNVDLGSYRAGKVDNLQYESNAWSGHIIGCYTSGVSSTITGHTITIYGKGAGDQKYWVHYDPLQSTGGIDKPHFEIGEMVRLDGFGLPGNNGVFRVTGIPASGIIRLGNVARCSSNLNCFAPNRNASPMPTRIETNHFFADPLAHNRCPARCNGHGRCNYDTNGTGQYYCRCDSSWIGDDCSLPALACPLNCSNHGTCDTETGRCHCEIAWSGLSCSESIQPCPNGCSGHGVCRHESGHCTCDSSFCGIDCSVPCNLCPERCSGHGRCDLKTSTCYCDPSWGGLDCSLPVSPCPDACSGHGKCEVSTGLCYCEKGGQV